MSLKKWKDSQQTNSGDKIELKDTEPIQKKENWRKTQRWDK